MNDHGRWVLSQALARAQGVLARRNHARDETLQHLRDCEADLADAQAYVASLSEALKEAGGAPVVKPVEIAA